LIRMRSLKMRAVSCASLLYALNIDPQWKKVLPEGDFAQQ
jgi:hypothetical protein